MEKSCTAQLTYVSSEIFPPAKKRRDRRWQATTQIPLVLCLQKLFSKRGHLRRLRSRRIRPKPYARNSKQMAERKQRAGINRVHIRPQDPACSSRLSSPTTAYSPRGQAGSGVVSVVVFTTGTAPEHEMPLRSVRGGLRRGMGQLFPSSAHAWTLKL